MIEEYKLFPTLVTRTKNLLTAQQCLDVFEYIKTLDMGNHEAIQNGKSTFDPKCFLLPNIEQNVESCKDICNVVVENIKEYISRTDFKIIEIANSWANIQNEDSVLQTHTHPLSTLSGALYVNVDKDSSKLFFDNPNPFLHVTNLGNVGSEYTCRSFGFELEIGDLVLFPSWLLHGSGGQPNLTKDRCVISFNTL